MFEKIKKFLGVDDVVDVCYGIFEADGVVFDVFGVRNYIETRVRMLTFLLAFPAVFLLMRNIDLPMIFAAASAAMIVGNIRYVVLAFYGYYNMRKHPEMVEGDEDVF